ncbi:MAG TPA: VOC family protein [Polyangia bacterium]
MKSPGTKASLGKLVAFVSTTDADRARTFYESVLGMRLVSDDDFAVVFDADGTTLRITKVESLAAAPFTVLGWEVADIAKAAARLRDRGVAFERYAGMAQDEHGIWLAPGGARVEWFKDPDGNLLSITEQAKP